MYFCHPHSLSPEKSPQSGQRTAGQSKASARKQRPTVFLEFGSQTKHVCTHKAQVTKTPHTLNIWVSVLACLPYSAISFSPLPFLLLFNVTSVFLCKGQIAIHVLIGLALHMCFCVYERLYKDHTPPPPRSA